MTEKSGDIRFFTVTESNAHLYNEKLKAFESNFSYPLGVDNFRICHGEHYFDFFKRLGEYRLSGVEDDNGIVATITGVLRTINGQHVWYLADLKALPDFKYKHLSEKLIRLNAPDYHSICDRYYAVAMKNQSGKDRINRFASRFGFASLSIGGSLEFFTLSHDEVTRLADEIEACLGPMSFCSLDGVKNLIVTSTGCPMPILHARRGGSMNPTAGFDHMFSVSEGSAFSALIKRNGISTIGSAFVYQSNTAFDINLLESHEI